MFDLLSTIKDILYGFFESVGTFFDFVVGFISDTVDVLVKAGVALGNAMTWIAVMIPPEAALIFTSILSVVVIYKFLGREG